MGTNERFFTVELKSKSNLKTVELSNGGTENVLIEGVIGDLQYATVADGVVLEVVGDKGTLRINLTKDEISEEKEVKSL